MRQAAAATLLLVGGALAAVALVAGDGGESGPGEAAQVTAYVNDPDRNEPGTAGGRRSVRLECFDRRGKPVIRVPHAWPFSDTDRGASEPHVHQRLQPERAGTLARCRLAGTDPLLRGEVRVPR